MFVRLAGPSQWDHALWAQAKPASVIHYTNLIHLWKTPSGLCGGHWDHPFPSAWETSCTRLMGLPVTQSRARVTDADCGMSIHGPCNGPKQCSIEWYQGWLGCDILLLIHITQIMHKLCTLCKYYANIMQKLRKNYAEIMQKICKNNVEIMQKLCKLCKSTNIMQIMHPPLCWCRVTVP